MIKFAFLTTSLWGGLEEFQLTLRRSVCRTVTRLEVQVDWTKVLAISGCVERWDGFKRPIGTVGGDKVTLGFLRVTCSYPITSYAVKPLMPLGLSWPINKRDLLILEQSLSLTKLLMPLEHFYLKNLVGKWLPFLCVCAYLFMQGQFILIQEEATLLSE